MPRDKKSLTAKQSVFVEEYLVDLNATQATIRAGYSEDTAQQIGSENLLSLIALMEPPMFGLMEPLSGCKLVPQTG